MKKSTTSLAYHKARTKDNLLWIGIVLALLIWGLAGCTTYRGNGCQQHHGMKGY